MGAGRVEVWVGLKAVWAGLGVMTGTVGAMIMPLAAGGTRLERSTRGCAGRFGVEGLMPGELFELEKGAGRKWKSGVCWELTETD